MTWRTDRDDLGSAMTIGLSSLAWRQRVHVQGWAVTPGLPRSAVGVAAFGPAGRLLSYAQTWEPRWAAANCRG